MALESKVLDLARMEGRAVLTEVESKELLEQADIPVVETRLAKSKKDAITISKELGFPVVLKIASPDIVHKSDSGGVKLGVANATQVGKAYSEIMSSIKEKYPNAAIQGLAIQRMAPPGLEVMIREIKGYPLLEGYRGQEPADISALEELIVKVSQFVDQNPEMKELDLNPIFAYRDRAVAVDARIILETPEKV
jgi:acyl-CoA synthetase (NDP forming)